ncbi:MAG: hypothetical protein DSY80_00515 [Desulfocapsa sp.]|nr:MAG: hypothetical protein DSY80_00515 [Desulfocapsa sp.]
MDDDKIINFHGATRLDLPADRVLREAINADLEDVVVVGWDNDGILHFASNKASGPEILWLLEVARKKLLEIEDE